MKLKNKESFARKGAQTISRFKSNALVSTSFNKDPNAGFEDKKINCLNYVISDSYVGKKSKTDDIFLQTQKLLDKRVKKELKQTLKHTKDLLSVDSSTITGAQHDEASESIGDSILSSSMQSSQKPKGTKLNALGSHEKSNTNKDKQTSPNSSFAQASKNSETQMTKVTSEPLVNNQIVKHAFNEELPKTIVYPLKYVERLLSQKNFILDKLLIKIIQYQKKNLKLKRKKRQQILLL